MLLKKSKENVIVQVFQPISALEERRLEALNFGIYFRAQHSCASDFDHINTYRCVCK